MRNEADIKNVKIALSGTVEIDLERVENDPFWASVAREFSSLEDPAQFKQALERYVSRYLGQEQVLEHAPFTNGPAAIFATNAEVI